MKNEKKTKQMKFMLNLVTIHHYAQARGCTTSYIYKLITEKKIHPILIDGMKFIDINKHPILTPRLADPGNNNSRQ